MATDYSSTSNRTIEELRGELSDIADAWENGGIFCGRDVWEIARDAESKLSAIEGDILCAIARIEQIGREGADTCGGLILDRLVTCDAPRLRKYIDADLLPQQYPTTEGETNARD